MSRRKKEETSEYNDIVGTVPASEHVKDCYAIYGQSVNTERALPLAYDGLKPVQRRVLLTIAKLSSGLHNATEVIGNCINAYHPHGDSSLSSALVTLVNKYKPLVDGKGNFGKYRSLNGRQPSAAMRYVKAGASKLLEELYDKYIDFAPTFLNENDNQEAEYLPCLIPYCLICGADGIGVGCATKIPHCNCEDLLNVAKLILEGNDKKAKSYKVRPIPDGGCGTLEITDEQLERFNTEGECQVYVSAKITPVWDEDESRYAYIITDFPENVNPSRILYSLRSEIDEKLVYIRDESALSVKIVVGREKRIKRITDEELHQKLIKCTRVRCSYRNYVVADGVAKVMTPYEMIKSAIEKLLEAESKYLQRKLDKVSTSILVELYKQDVAKELMVDTKKMEPKHIISRISERRPEAKDELTESLVKTIMSKSISILKSAPKDLKELYKEQAELQKYIEVPAKYYLDYQYNIVKDSLLKN